MEYHRTPWKLSFDRGFVRSYTANRVTQGEGRGSEGSARTTGLRTDVLDRLRHSRDCLCRNERSEGRRPLRKVGENVYVQVSDHLENGARTREVSVEVRLNLEDSKPIWRGHRTLRPNELRYGPFGRPTVGGDYGLRTTVALATVIVPDEQGNGNIVLRDLLFTPLSCFRDHTGPGHEIVYEHVRSAGTVEVDGRTFDLGGARMGSWGCRDLLLYPALTLRWRLHQMLPTRPLERPR